MRTQSSSARRSSASGLVAQRGLDEGDDRRARAAGDEDGEPEPEPRLVDFVEPRELLDDPGGLHRRVLVVPLLGVAHLGDGRRVCADRRMRVHQLHRLLDRERTRRLDGGGHEPFVAAERARRHQPGEETRRPLEEGSQLSHCRLSRERVQVPDRGESRADTRPLGHDQGELHEITDRDPVLRVHSGDLRLEGPIRFNGARMHLRHVEASPQVEPDRRKVVVGGDQPEPMVAARRGHLPRHLEQRRPGPNTARIRMERHHLQAPLGVLVDRGQSDRLPVALRHQAVEGERVDELAQPRHGAYAAARVDQQALGPGTISGRQVPHLDAAEHQRVHPGASSRGTSRARRRSAAAARGSCVPGRRRESRRPCSRRSRHGPPRRARRPRRR